MEIDLRRTVDRLGGLPKILAASSPAERKGLYKALGIELRYNHRTRTVEARQDASRWWGYERVGGDITPLRTRIELR